MQIREAFHILRLLASVGEGEGGMIWEQHWNMYIIKCETDHQSRLDACRQVLSAGALGRPRGMGCGGRWEGVQDGEHM